MEKTCKTCRHWQVFGSGPYGKASYPGAWGQERRGTDDITCPCAYNLEKRTYPDETCDKWAQAEDIIDECFNCGALLFKYDRPATPGMKREIEHKGHVYFWACGDLDCEHEGENYHGLDPRDCGMCQGTGYLGHMIRCDACHGSGESILGR